MSESERRRKYRYDRVLIETARVLDPQFDDAVVYLTGAQIEMLRNMTQYLNNLDTYVSEQFLGYYLVPTVEEYDSVLAIVADLEETLMGNPNTIWGYKDRLAVPLEHEMTENATYNMEIVTVPAGHVYVINAMMTFNTATLVETRHRIYDGVAYYDIEIAPAQPSGMWLVTAGVNYVLKEGDKVVFTWIAAQDGDMLLGRVLGSMMVVP